MTGCKSQITNVHKCFIKFWYKIANGWYFEKVFEDTSLPEVEEGIDLEIIDLNFKFFYFILLLIYYLYLLNIAGFPILSHEFCRSFSILSHDIKYRCEIFFYFFEKSTY